MTETSQKNVAVSLFILRLGVGAFMLMWALEKFVLPSTSMKIYKNFFFVEPSETGVLVAGTVLTVIALMVLCGAFKKFSYGAILLFHTSTVIFTIPKIIDPYGLISGKPGHLFFAAIPIWAAIFLLFKLRDLDTFKSWDARK